MNSTTDHICTGGTWDNDKKQFICEHQAPTDHTDGKPMTNYNERLDDKLTEILRELDRGEYLDKGGVPGAKQAITSLYKELVAKAKPERQKTENMGDTFKVNWARGHNVAIEQFEQNLLKVLEEK